MDFASTEQGRTKVLDQDTRVKRDLLLTDFSSQINHQSLSIIEASRIALSEEQIKQLQYYVGEEVAARIVGRTSNEEKMPGRTNGGQSITIDPLKERRRADLKKMGNIETLENVIDTAANQAKAQVLLLLAK